MAKFISNKEIARMLREVAAAYEAQGENRFKVIAYDNAATFQRQSFSLRRQYNSSAKIVYTDS